MNLRRLGSGLLMVWSVSVSAQVTRQSDYQQQLDHYIDLVNQTKLVLDEPSASVTPKAQKQALCMRIQAYQSIVALTKQYNDQDTALTMQAIAEHYLNQQKHSFKQSGMDEAAFCADGHVEVVRN